MKCKICGEKGIIKFKAHNISLCEKCLLDFIKRRVKRTINRFSLIKKGERALVAVSGGKDSLSVWDILLELGYHADGVYIDLGIDGYSERSKEKALSFARGKGAELFIEEVRAYFDGLGIPDLSRRTSRPPCSLCGMIKRYIMNKVAFEKNYDVLVTGHNLDDETSSLLSNILDWREGYIERQSPLLPEVGKKLVRKVKPLALCTEREIASYAIVKGIDYIREECPLSRDSTFLFYKHILNEIEERSPGTKLRFYQGFLEAKKNFVRKEVELRECEECGFLSTASVCNFCRFRNTLRARAL